MPLPCVDEVNSTVNCPFCDKTITRHYFYTHLARSHFSNLMTDFNKKRIETALNLPVINPEGLHLKIGDDNYLFNPLKGRLYLSKKTWAKGMKNAKKDDFDAKLRELLNFSTEKPVGEKKGIDTSEIEPIQKIINKMSWLLKSEREDMFEKEAQNRALRSALLRFMPESEIDKLEPEYEDEIEHIDLQREFKKELPEIKSFQPFSVAKPKVDSLSPAPAVPKSRTERQPLPVAPLPSAPHVETEVATQQSHDSTAQVSVEMPSQTPVAPVEQSTHSTPPAEQPVVSQPTIHTNPTESQPLSQSESLAQPDSASDKPYVPALPIVNRGVLPLSSLQLFSQPPPAPVQQYPQIYGKKPVKRASSASERGLA